MSAALAPDRVTARVEDVRFLLADDVPPRLIARRLGVSTEGLEKFFRRLGMPELARPFAREMNRRKDLR